jgi:hypothetical protein
MLSLIVLNSINNGLMHFINLLNIASCQEDIS